MRVLITGINGFIGRHLTTWMVGQGHAVSGIARDEAEQKIASVSYHYGSVEDATFMEETGRKTDPEVIVHLAGMTQHDIITEYPYRMLSSQLAGVENVIRIAGARVRVVFASSCAVYGSPGSLPVYESSACDPCSVLGKAKKIAEDLLLAATTDLNLDVRIARIFNVYGEGQADRFLVSSCLSQLQNSRTLQLGNLTSIRDYLHVSDVVTALTLLATDDDVTDTVFNVCSGIPVSPVSIVQDLETLMDARLHVVSSEDRKRVGEVTAIYGDNARLKSWGWKQHVQMENGLRTLLKSNNLLPER